MIGFVRLGLKSGPPCTCATVMLGAALVPELCAAWLCRNLQSPVLPCEHCRLCVKVPMLNWACCKAWYNHYI